MADLQTRLAAFITSLGADIKALLPRVETVNVVASSGAAKTIPDPATGATVSKITMDANCTFTFPALPAAGLCKTFTLITVQDATGSRLWTLPTIKWPNGIVPVLSTAPGAIDIHTFMGDSTGWFGFVGGKAFA